MKTLARRRKRLVAAVCLAFVALAGCLVPGAPLAAQELTVKQVIELLIAGGALTDEKAAEARKAIEILALERLKTEENQGCPQLNRTLSLGSQGSDVEALQTYLAKFSHVYPEGLVTGYYGALTQAAVRRYQARLGIVSSGSAATTGYGAVGPATRRALANCRAPAAPQAVSSADGSPAPTGPAGMHLRFLPPPYVSLDAVTYGELITVYFKYFRGWEGDLIRMARADLRDPGREPFQRNVIVALYPPSAPARLMIYEGGVRDHRFLLNDEIDVASVFVYTSSRYRAFGYQDLAVTTPRGETIYYRATQEGRYERLDF